MRRVEKLEDRRVMAAAILDGTTVKIEGTDEADTVVVEQVQDQIVVTVNEETSRFALEDVSAIKAQLNDGADQFFAEVGEQLQVNVNGGQGDDVIEVVGASVAHLVGKEGDDQLTTREALFAILDGGTGNDQLAALDATDWGGLVRLFGRDGDDTIVADEVYRAQIRE